MMCDKIERCWDQGLYTLEDLQKLMEEARKEGADVYSTKNIKHLLKARYGDMTVYSLQKLKGVRMLFSLKIYAIILLVRSGTRSGTVRKKAMIVLRVRKL